MADRLAAQAGKASERRVLQNGRDQPEAQSRMAGDSRCAGTSDGEQWSAATCHSDAAVGTPREELLNRHAALTASDEEIQTDPLPPCHVVGQNVEYHL